MIIRCNHRTRALLTEGALTGMVGDHHVEHVDVYPATALSGYAIYLDVRYGGKSGTYELSAAWTSGALTWYVPAEVTTNGNCQMSVRATDGTNIWHSLQTPLYIFRTSLSVSPIAIPDNSPEAEAAKADIVAEINARGGSASVDDDWDEIVAALESMPEGLDVSDATATAAQILAGATAYLAAGKTTGTMPDRAGDNACTSSSVDGTTLKLVAPEGYYDGTDTVTVTDADFTAANIKDGVEIFGVTGTMTSAPITYEIINPASLLNVVIPSPTYP